MPAPEFDDRSGHEVPDGRRPGCDPDAAGLAVSQVGHLTERAVDMAQSAGRGLIQDLARFGDRDAAGLPLQERHAELGFKSLDVLAHR